MHISTDLINQINQLPPLEKLQLAELLLAELDAPNPEIDTIWATEAQARWQAYRNGEQQSVNYETVMQKYK
jgi:putative addiction module component (TIGR02574 family)